MSRRVVPIEPMIVRIPPGEVNSKRVGLSRRRFGRKLVPARRDGPGYVSLRTLNSLGAMFWGLPQLVLEKWAFETCVSLHRIPEVHTDLLAERETSGFLHMDVSIEAAV